MDLDELGRLVRAQIPNEAKKPAHAKGSRLPAVDEASLKFWLEITEFRKLGFAVPIGSFSIPLVCSQPKTVLLHGPNSLAVFSYA